MKNLVITLLFAFATLPVIGQSNLRFTNPIIEEVLFSNYDPQDYRPTAQYDTPEELAMAIKVHVSADSLKSYLLDMQRFENRNTGSDTLSPVRGIGAARTWVLDKFNAFSSRVDNRLLTGYFQFDQDVCGVTRHKNVVALLPGTDPAARPIIIEAHLDSRCSGPCDVDCLAQGMEDNGSGTALVMELARVLAPYEFRNSILFVATTGEEQGLVGATALAEFFVQNELDIKLIQNNDIVGGIVCGETSSPPSCPGFNNIDSTQVRLFSRGGFNSAPKGLARFIKLQYEEMLRPIEEVPMLLTIMTAEDRTGRGGDHIPFRERGFAAMRFTSANEHGNASNDAEYHDRQHTSTDILGVDTDTDGELDSFFVNFNYLARNTRINGVTAAMAAIGPSTPRITEHFFDGDRFGITIESDIEYPGYVIGLRTGANDFDSLYYFTGNTSPLFETAKREFSIFLSVAAIDSNNVESLFSEEVLSLLSGTRIPEEIAEKPIRLMPNRPNPFDEATTLSFWCEKPVSYEQAYLMVSDQSGRPLAKMPTEIQVGLNEVLYRHGYNVSGILVQSLVIDGRIVDSGTMIFAN